MDLELPRLGLGIDSVDGDGARGLGHGGSDVDVIGGSEEPVTV